MEAIESLDDKKEIRAKLGERIKIERQRMGLSQSEFSELARVSKASQVGYESGVNAPDAVYLTRMAEHIDLLFVLTGVRASVHAGRQLDWNLITQVNVQIRRSEVERGIALPAESLARFQRILYAASVSTGEVDLGVLNAVFQTAV